MAQNLSSDSPEMQEERQGNSSIFWGAIAIIGGALIVVSQFAQIQVFMPWIVLGLGVAMLAWGVVNRSAGGLIPGGIVSGVGLGLVATPLVGRMDLMSGDMEESIILFCLALGFLSIPLTTKVFTEEFHWWGFIPGGILFLVALAISFGGVWFQALNLLQYGGAVALVGLGAWLIYRWVQQNRSAE